MLLKNSCAGSAAQGGLKIEGRMEAWKPGSLGSLDRRGIPMGREGKDGEAAEDKGKLGRGVTVPWVGRGEICF